MKLAEIADKYYLDKTQFTNYILKSGIPYTYKGMEILIEDIYVKDCVEAFWEYNDEKEKERQQALHDDAIKRKAMSKMLITSGFNFDGYRIVKYSGYISGDDAMTVSRGSSFTDGGVRDKLMNSLTQIRRNALRELKEAAYDLGCNAVIGVDFDYITLDPQTANISGGTTYQPYVFCVTANGNAVIIEKIED